VRRHHRSDVAPLRLRLFSHICFIPSSIDGSRCDAIFLKVMDAFNNMHVLLFDVERKRLRNMATQEDVFRQQVVTLLSRCNNDVPTLMKSIARSLNECGRSDVRADVDSTGTVITVAQSPFHVSAHMTNFQNSLERLVADAKRELASIVPPTTMPGRAAPTAVASTTTKATSGTPLVPQNAIPSVTQTTTTAAATSRAQSPPPTTGGGNKSIDSHAHRSFKNSRNPRDTLPTSQFNGNYLLFRYGGKFPKHGNYGFYRRYGCEGQGAVTSEFHHLPGGQRPDRSHLYV
jgi:hypothetical protein